MEIISRRIGTRWGALAATNGWLVFEPNYRGSIGYGDAVALGIIPHIVSRPGKDVLEGVDALVKDGIADPNHLAVGGYSYGGVRDELADHADDAIQGGGDRCGRGGTRGELGERRYDDGRRLFSGRKPWEAKENYDAEAAIWQIGKVTTPTLVAVGGGRYSRVCGRAIFAGTGALSAAEFR